MVHVIEGGGGGGWGYYDNALCLPILCKQDSLMRISKLFRAESHNVIAEILSTLEIIGRFLPSQVSVVDVLVHVS